MLRNFQCRGQLSACLNHLNKAIIVSSQRFSSKYAKPIGEDFDMAASFTHSEETGYVRHSAFGEIEKPNQQMHQFVWQNMAKWQDHIAMVGF